MANGTTHYAVGAMTGIAMAINGQHKDEPVDPLLAIASSTVFAKLPDIIEPAIHPHHRQFFHSHLPGCPWGVPKNAGNNLLRRLVVMTSVVCCLWVPHHTIGFVTTEANTPSQDLIRSILCETTGAGNILLNPMAIA